MSAHHQEMTRLEDPGPVQSARLQKLAYIAIAIGLAGIGWSFAAGGQERFWSSLLQGMLVPLYLSLGAMFYLSVHTVGNATWIMPVRRLIEGMTAGLPVAVVIAILIIFVGSGWLYDWAYLHDAHHEHLFHTSSGDKASYMTWTRFMLMNVAILAAWMAVRHFFIGASIKQDNEPGCIRKRSMPLAITFLMIFALSFTGFIWDFLLTLQVNWFSTMWAVYALSSMIQTFLCVLVLLVLHFRRGQMKHHLGEHTIHDLGTWMVAWSCFCAYIGFSQFMLIYYANLDEETYFYVMRTQHGYGWWFIFDALLRWPLPFLGLMSQKVRTSPKALTIIAALVLLGNWLDWSWLILPAMSPNEYRSFIGPERLVAFGAFGAWLLPVLRFWQKHGLLAKGEPRLLPAINAEHMH